MENDSELTLRDEPAASRYEGHLGDRLVAFSEYRLVRGGRIIFTHTEVHPDFEGRGIGSRLARFLIEDARVRGLRITPHCPFIRAYLMRHREYDSVVDWPPEATPPGGHAA